jgi:plastocyanin
MALIAALLAPAGARGGDTIQIAIEPGGFDVFAPDDATATLGAESFAFHWVDPPTDDGHNVVSKVGLFDSGPASVDQPDYLLAPSAGSYRYFCEVHSDGKQGMIGRVAVRPAAGNPPPDDGYRVAWATDETRTGDSFDVRYRVGDGGWRDWKQGTERLRAVFGHAGSPVEVKPAQTYRLQARSGKAGKPSKRSDWSPALVAGP